MNAIPDWFSFSDICSLSWFRSVFGRESTATYLLLKYSAKVEVPEVFCKVRFLWRKKVFCKSRFLWKKYSAKANFSEKVFCKVLWKKCSSKADFSETKIFCKDKFLWKSILQISLKKVFCKGIFLWKNVFYKGRFFWEKSILQRQIFSEKKSILQRQICLKKRILQRQIVQEKVFCKVRFLWMIKQCTIQRMQQHKHWIWSAAGGIRLKLGKCHLDPLKMLRCANSLTIKHVLFQTLVFFHFVWVFSRPWKKAPRNWFLIKTKIVHKVPKITFVPASDTWTVSWQTFDISCSVYQCIGY